MKIKKDIRKNIFLPKLIFIVEKGKSFLEENWIRFLFSEIDEKNIIFLSPNCIDKFLVKLNKFDFPIFIFSENCKLSKGKIYLLKKFNFKYGLIHLSDEWFVADYAKLYNGATFVLRNYLNKALLNISNIQHIPIGYKLGNLEKKIQSVAKNNDQIFFKGEIKGERLKMLYDFKKSGLIISSGSKKRLSYPEYLLQLKTYKYGLSPYGNTTPDTLRIYEYLENDVLPILGSKKSFDYFILLFKENPPFFYDKSWRKVSIKFSLEKNKIQIFNSFKQKNWWEGKKEKYKKECNSLVSEDFILINNCIKIKYPSLVRLMSFIWLLKLQKPTMLIARIKKIFYINSLKKLMNRIFQN